MKYEVSKWRIDPSGHRVMHKEIMFACSLREVFERIDESDDIQADTGAEPDQSRPDGEDGGGTGSEADQRWLDAIAAGLQKARAAV